MKQYKRLNRRAFVLAALFPWSVPLHAAETSLTDLDLRHIRVGWGQVGKNMSISGKPLKVGSQSYAKGLGLHTSGHMTLKLDGNATLFRCRLGIDAEAGARGKAMIVVYGDDMNEIARSPVVEGGDEAREFQVSLARQKRVIIALDDCGENAYDHLNLIEPVVVHAGEISLVPDAVVSSEPYLLTPPAPQSPRINPPRIVGVRPGSPLLFRVPTSGVRPMVFRAKGLPAGLQLDEVRGIIKGTIHAAEHRTYPVEITSRNAYGTATETVRLVVGSRIALTPPMGWNSWYVWSESVNQQHFVEAAKLFDSSGIADYGWAYINLDDCWQGERGGRRNALQPNEKFPDIKQAVDQIHTLGLKAGIYSTPWIGSYAGFRGGSAANSQGTYAGLSPAERLQPGQIFGRFDGLRKFGVDRVGENWFFDRDIEQIAEWRFDYIKVDWQPIDIPTTERISRDVRSQKRDIVLSLSNGATFSCAADYARLAELWRTTGDIHDSWGSIAGIGFSQFQWVPFAGPGHWNDPDMLQIGYTNSPNQLVKTSRASKLTPEEQYTQVSLWAMLAAPLVLSCDLEKLDAFTLNLITNSEIIGVNQDPKGMPAVKLPDIEGCVAMRRPLEGGDHAVGIFNTHDFLPKKISVSAAALGCSSGSKVLDLWTHQVLPWQNGSLNLTLRPHACAMLRVSAQTTKH